MKYHKDQEEDVDNNNNNEEELNASNNSQDYEELRQLKDIKSAITEKT